MDITEADSSFFLSSLLLKSYRILKGFILRDRTEHGAGDAPSSVLDDTLTDQLLSRDYFLMRTDSCGNKIFHLYVLLQLYQTRA